MNKKTRAARKGCPKEGVAPNSCQRERTIGTGVGRQFAYRDDAPIFKGKYCNTARPAGKRKWVGALQAAKQGGGGEN